MIENIFYLYNSLAVLRDIMNSELNPLLNTKIALIELNGTREYKLNKTH